MAPSGVVPRKYIRHSGRTHAVGEIRNLLSMATKQRQIPGSSPMKPAMPRNDDVSSSGLPHQAFDQYKFARHPGRRITAIRDQQFLSAR
jgi:hypothetical protein